MRFLLAIFVMMLAVGVARAQSTLTQNLSAQKLPTFSGNMSLGYNSNFNRQTDANSYQSASADFTLNYRVQGSNLLRGYVGGYKELTGGQEWKPNDGFFAWVNNAFWSRGERVTLGQQIRISLPYSKDSRDRDTKLAGVSVVPVMQVRVTPAVLFIYQPQLTKNFHTYKQNRAGANNVEYAVNHTFVGSWSINDYWYFQPVVIYGNSWSYGGTYRDPIYQAAGEVGYSLNSTMTLAAGWTNAGAIRRFEQGSDQTIQLFNNNTSTWYTALYWIF